MRLDPFQVERFELQGDRFYRTPVGVCPSVTTVLAATKPEEDVAGLAAWRAEVGDEEADRIETEARERGTALHARIEEWATDPFREPEPAADPLDPWWSSVVRALALVEEPLLVEAPVWHAEAGFAGTIDLLARIRGGRLCLFDWKTARRGKRRDWIRDYEIQVAAYAGAIRRLYGVDLSTACVVVAYADGPADLFWLDLDDLRSGWADFVPRLRAWKKVGP